MRRTLSVQQQTRLISAKQTKRTLLSQRNAQCSTREKRLTATRTSLRGLNVARTGVVSWLRAIRLTFPAAIAASGPTSRCSSARYSGGAAPAFYPFSLLPPPLAFGGGAIYAPTAAPSAAPTPPPSLRAHA